MFIHTWHGLLSWYTCQHMTKGVIKTEDARLVTVGTMKKALGEFEVKIDKSFSEMDEKFVTNDRFDRSMTAIADSFNRVHESIAIIIRELGSIRQENREFRQEREQLYRTGVIHERKIDELDTRVLKLETANQ